MKTLELNGVEYVILERAEFDELSDVRASRRALTAPTVDAISFTRGLLADRLRAAMKRAGWTQAELSKRARVRTETISRIMNRKHTVDSATWGKIEGALSRVGVQI